jgi:HD-like signal output (HDOD) protein
LRLGFGGEEFCAGMLHDVGRLIIAASDIDHFAMVDQMDFNEGPETLENELKYWDTDHCAIGVEFAYKSRLPSSLANAIMYHHAPEKAESDERLVALVAFADQVTNHAQRHRRISNFDFTSSKALKLLGSGNTQNWSDETLPTVLSATVKKAIMATRTLIKAHET